jgi:hypothetical protein
VRVGRVDSDDTQENIEDSLYGRRNGRCVCGGFKILNSKKREVEGGETHWLVRRSRHWNVSGLGFGSHYEPTNSAWA